MLRYMPSIAAVAGAAALSLWGLASAAAGESSQSSSLADGQARFEPIQAITYEFGSKLTTGYFVAQDRTCIVTLMIAEKTDPEEPLGLSPMRVRLALAEGQVAGFDSEEGRSLNFTCETGAATLLVDFGERNRLIALQDAALRQTVAHRP